MKSRKNRWSLALRYILLLLGGAVSVMPMIYMLSTSLRPNGALYEFPPHFGSMKNSCCGNGGKKQSNKETAVA